MFLAVTSTPGINAPLESDTVPLRIAFTCDNAEFGKTTHSNKANVTTHFLILRKPPP
jgi:hypothetical protein